MNERRLVLIILDGFGVRADRNDNAIALARAPRLHELWRTGPMTELGASGPDVGLPPGQMGISEVGHLNLGAGRIAQMDISRIDCAVADGTLKVWDVASGSAQRSVDLGASKVTARMTPDQTGAITLFEECGFRTEALLHDHVRDDEGTEHDLAVLFMKPDRESARREAFGD